MWAYIETHPDVITNILDIISFIFVTPQLLKLANATNALIGSFVFFGIIFCIFYVLVIISIDIIYCLSLQTTDWVVIPWILFFTILFPYVMLYVLRRKTVMTFFFALIITLGRHMFPIGLALFFISRLLALAFAIYR